MERTKGVTGVTVAVNEMTFDWIYLIPLAMVSADVETAQVVRATTHLVIFLAT